MGFCQLHSKEARHTGLPLNPCKRESLFHKHPHQVGLLERNTFLDNGNIKPSKKLVEPIPKIDRFTLGDKIGLAGPGGGAVQILRRQDKGIRGIINIGDINKIVAVADPLQLPASGLAQKARDMIGVSRPPDKMGTQGYGFQGAAVGLKDHFLGNGLTLGVIAKEISGIGSAFVHPAQIIFLINNRRCAGIDEGMDVICTTGI